MEPEAQSFDSSHQRIGHFDTFALGVNGVIGSGIFFLPSVGDKLLGPAAIFSTLLAGVLAWMIAGAFGVVASDYRRNGGAYVYTRDYFGEGPGFVVGWMTWLVAVTSWGALLNALFLALAGLAETFGHEGVKASGMAALVLLLILVNTKGLVLGARFSTVLTFLKATPLILLAIVGLPDIQWERFAPLSPNGWGGFADATLLILYAYVGFESLVVPAAEIRNVDKTMPRLLPMLILSVTALYLALQAVCIGTLDELGQRTNPIADGASLVFGGTLGAAFLWVSVVSVLGVNAGTALVTPRRLAALADEGDAPAFLAKKHPRYQTPMYAIALTGLVALGFALAGSFKELALLSVVARFVQYLPTCWIAFRRREMGGRQVTMPERSKAVIALVVSLALLGAADVEKLLAGGVALVILTGTYWLHARGRRNYSK